MVSWDRVLTLPPRCTTRGRAGSTGSPTPVSRNRGQSFEAPLEDLVASFLLSKSCMMTPLRILKEKLATPVPGPAIEANGIDIETPAGRIHVYEDVRGDGAPVVFVHSVNAAASAREMYPLFDRIRGERPAIAFDLPGFGKSERGDRKYDKRLYADALTAVLQRSNDRSGRAADVVALSLGCEFAATVAVESPALVRTLTLISPTGFGHRTGSRGWAEETWEKVARRVRSSPLLGGSLYSLLVSRPSIHHFYSKSFVHDVDRSLEDYAVATARGRGARFAPLAFVSGDLFDRDVLHSVYQRVTQPVLVIYDQDAYSSFELLPASDDQWRVERVEPTRGLPQFDELERTVATMRSFWAPFLGEDRRELDATEFQDGWGGRQAH
jgi:pimeloyl-ACP methyl ester carboxylesterase